MRGTAFLDQDTNLGWRSEDYLTNDDPSFFQNNDGMLLKAWIFDTDNFSSMYAMFSSMRDLKLRQQSVLDFSRSIGFNINDLKNPPK